MADYDGSIRIGAELDTSGATKELTNLTGELEKSASSAGQIGDKLKTGLAVAGAAIGAATAAVGAFAKSSLEVGASFDSSMSQVAATMGKTTGKIGELRSYALEMGATTAFSATQAADALNYMALAGYDSQQAMDALPNVLNLAAAGGMELATASDMVTDAQSALGLSMEESAQLVDKMAMTSSKSNTSVAQLGEAILTVGGTAKNLAGGTTELSTALGILADNGVKGAEGGTALRNIILSLSAPTDKAAKALASMGVEVFDAAGNMRPLNETFGDLNTALSSMTQGQQTQVLSEIFNKVDLKSVNALLANTGERFDELSGYIDNAAGAAEKMANTQLDNLAGDITLFQSALEGAQIALSDQLTPKLREFTQFGTEAITTLSEAFKEGGLTGAMEALGTILSEGLTMIIEQLPAMIDAGAQLLGAIGQGLLDNLPTITAAALEIIQNLVQGLGEALPEMIPAAAEAILKFAEGLTNPKSTNGLLKAATEVITGLAKGIVSALPLLIEYAPKIIANLVIGLIGAIPQLIEAGVQLLAGLGEGLLKGLLSLPKIIKEVVDGVVNGFKDLFGIHSPSTVFSELGGYLIDGLLEGISNVWSSIVEFFGSKPKEIAETLSKTWDTIKTTASEKWKTISDSLSKAWDSVKSAAKEKFDAVKTKIGETWDSLKKTTAEKWEGVKSSLVKTWDTIKKNAGDKFDEVREKIGDAWDTIKEEAPKKWDDISSSLKNKWDTIKEDAKGWGKDLCRNLSDGIESGIQWVKTAASNVASKIGEYLHFSEPDVGPLSNFHTFMPDMLKLMAEGIQANEHLAVSAVRHMAGSMADVMTAKNMRYQLPSISSFNLPAIANGAVIPPSFQFSKLTVDAPAQSAPALSSNELSAILGALNDIRSAVRDGKVLAVDGNTFARLVYDGYNRESGRVGVRLVNTVIK